MTIHHKRTEDRWDLKLPLMQLDEFDSLPVAALIMKEQFWKLANWLSLVKRLDTEMPGR